jgi:hypothetical protein
MKSATLLFTFLMLFASTTVVLAQHATSNERMTVSQIEDHSVGAAEHSLVPLADAMPEDKYSFAPTNGQFKGVRTFAEMVKHVAVSNYGMASAILHENPPVKLDTDADVAAITTKADILKFLKGSFEFLHKALSSINEISATDPIQSPDSDKPLPRLEIADRALWHCWDHHGQLVEYLRMNGIVPPGSH